MADTTPHPVENAQGEKSQATVAGFRADQVEFVGLPSDSVAFALIRFGANAARYNVQEIENVLCTLARTRPYAPAVLVCFSDEPIDVQNIDSKTLRRMGWVRRDELGPMKVELRGHAPLSPELLKELRGVSSRNGL